MHGDGSAGSCLRVVDERCCCSCGEVTTMMRREDEVGGGNVRRLSMTGGAGFLTVTVGSMLLSLFRCVGS
jgi:hypothetical protein